MYFKRFCEERGIKEETIKAYKTTIKKYSEFYEMSLDELIDEALEEQLDTSIPKIQRKIQQRFVSFRTHLIKNTELKHSTIINHMGNLRTLYRQFYVEIPDLPKIRDKSVVETTYFDLPNKKQISMALEIAGIRLGSLILFMASSGTAREECSNITIGTFIKACKDYYTKETLEDIIEELYSSSEDIVPTFSLLRVKTQKKYVTFCTPEATHAILEWLMFRLEMANAQNEELSLDDSLWDWSVRQITYHFARINDEIGFGFAKQYRFFTPHALRKFNGSNIGLSADRIDAIHGRSKDVIHSTYIKNNPVELKKVYMNVMDNVTIGDAYKKEIIHEEFTININLNFYMNESSVSL